MVFQYYNDTRVAYTIQLHCVTQGKYAGVVIKWVYSAIHYQQGITIKNWHF